MAFQDIYKQLTSVDINEQRQIWDERGKGYYGEYLLFCELYANIPGTCKILMNLNIPVNETETTEIDLLLIHETGLYVFEIKHYKGTIYGNDSDEVWTQYFRTTKNSVFRNPIVQNGYHIRALKNMFPSLPMRSVIVFTNNECEFKIKNTNSELEICVLKDVISRVRRRVDLSISVLNTEKIDAIFGQLSKFSPMQTPVEQNRTVAPFASWLQPTINRLEISKEEVNEKVAAIKKELDEVHNRKVKELELKKQEAEKTRSNWFSRMEELQQLKGKWIAGAVAAIALAFIISVSVISGCRIKYNADLEEYRSFANEEIANAQEKVNAMSQKFEHVKPYNNGNIVMEDGFITASNVRLSKSVDVENAVNLQFTLNWNGEYYGANISRNVKIIVILTDGSVKEYDLLESSFPYSSADLRLGKRNPYYNAYTSYEFPVHELAALKLGDISYIKLSGIDVWVTEDGGVKPVILGTGYEVRIY